MIENAAMLAIGDELLSGRTKDRNIGYLADALTLAGIDLKEVRIVADEPEDIAAAINELRGRYTYLFTSGGIGPTHDDLTADAVAAAFGVPIGYHPQAYDLLERHYRERGLEFTLARKRMARTPEGATLVDNAVSVAPGFHIGNVYVMAGVPAVFQAMLNTVVSSLPQGAQILSASVFCPFGEGDIGGPLADVQARHPHVVIGSYPKFDGNNYSTELVARSRDAQELEAARLDIEAMLQTVRDKRAS